MIYIDFSHLLISCYFAQEKEVAEVTEGDFRKHVLHTLFHLHNRFKHQFGQMVICCEGRRSWRYDIYPHYKVKRKVARADDAVKWKEIDRLNHLLKNEMIEHGVFKVVSVPGAEGDDVIAILSRHIEEPSLIVSEDRDFHQLHKLPYVSQYSKRRDSVYKSPEPELELREKIIRGDRNDSIPNIHSKDNVFLLNERQVMVSAKMFQRYNDNFFIGEGGIPEVFRSNVERNDRLINFDNIPENIRAAVLHDFSAATQSNLFGRGKRTHYLIQAGINPNQF